MENAIQEKIVKDIAESYSPKTEEKSRFERLTALDAKVRRPAEIFTYSFGTAGTLVLGLGMCLAMGTIASGAAWAMPAGIVIGVAGLAIICTNYFIYKVILKRRKAKYAEEILKLSDELLKR